MSKIRSDRGQATVEFAAVIPIVVLACLAVAQLSVFGFGLWSASGAARAGARAALVGGNAERVAADAVPAPFHAEATVDGARVRIELRPPSLLPGVRMPAISTSAGLDPAAGSGP
ncbi:hypothetical protein BH10ACT11_BH10ACT11_15830 [soil metagenome]